MMNTEDQIEFVNALLSAINGRDPGTADNITDALYSISRSLEQIALEIHGLSRELAEHRKDGV